MGVGFEARLSAIFGVDQIHRFALACGEKELPIAGGGDASAPERGHGQCGLRPDHHGQGAVQRVAFDMPARQAGELEIIMRIGCFGHLAKAKVQALCKQNIQQADLIVAWGPGANVGEGFGKTRGLIHFQQEVGDPYIGQPSIQIQNEFICFSGNGGGQTFDFQGAILDRAARNGPVSCCVSQAFQPICHACFAVGQPVCRIEWNGQSGRGSNLGHRHQGLLQISITPGMGKPYIARAKGLAQMEQDRHFPKPMIVGLLTLEMTVPFAATAQKDRRSRCRLFTTNDKPRRSYQRLGYGGRKNVERPQHAWRIASKPIIPLYYMG